MTTIPIGQLTGASLLIGIALMFIGDGLGLDRRRHQADDVLDPAGLDRVDHLRPPAHRGVRPARVGGHRLPRAVGRPAVGRARVRDDPAAPGHDPVRRLLPIAFETVSAFGTVGDSTGITPTLPDTLAAGADRHDVRRTARAAHLRPRPRGAHPGGHRPARARDDPDRLNQRSPHEDVGPRHRSRALRRVRGPGADGASATRSSPSTRARRSSTRSRRT